MKEAKSSIALTQLTLFKAMFPGEFNPHTFAAWRKQIPATLDDIRTNPGRNTPIPTVLTETAKFTVTRKKQHQGIPLPSAKSLNDSSVVRYSSYDDIRLWLDAEAWIGDDQTIDAMLVTAEAYINRTFPEKINTNSFVLVAKGFFNYGRYPDAISTTIVDGLLELFNEMCTVPGRQIGKSNRREPGPFFKSVQFGRLSKTARDRIPNVTTHWKGTKAET